MWGITIEVDIEKEFYERKLGKRKGKSPVFQCTVDLMPIRDYLSDLIVPVQEKSRLSVAVQVLRI
jgi:hypothetical protein